MRTTSLLLVDYNIYGTCTAANKINIIAKFDMRVLSCELLLFGWTKELQSKEHLTGLKLTRMAIYLNIVETTDIRLELLGIF